MTRRDDYVHQLMEQWKSYRRACYGDEPMNAHQLHECRQAFYSGLLVGISFHPDGDLIGALARLTNIEPDPVLANMIAVRVPRPKIEPGHN